jgi:2-oxo-3-hexenedioate decarboxylase
LKFRAPDGIADYGLHARLVVGPPLAVTPDNIALLVAGLPGVEVTLQRDGEPVDTGVGANVLGSPALALAHLARVLATQPWAPPLAAGELITTGTVTDAWPVAPGETWTSDYGALGISGLAVTFT